MILVDTSVLIDYLRGRENNKVDLFGRILNRGIPYGISSEIYLEILQGARSEREFETLRDYLGSLPFYGLTDPRESAEEAARMTRRCRHAGVTIRSTIDVLIARIAAENELLLLHDDADFDRIAGAVGEPRILNLSGIE